MTMKTLPLAAVAFVAAALAAGGTALLLDGSNADRELGRDPDLSGRIDRLVERLDRLEARELDGKARPGAGTSVDPERIEALVEAALARRGSEAPERTAAAIEPPQDAAAAAATDFDLNRTIAQLTSPDLGNDEREALWKRVAAAGAHDAVIAALEERAKNAPGDADAQADLGEAYVQKLIGNRLPQSESGALAMKSDAAYDRALAIDETHWRARFNKAISLAFWPAPMGKQPVAIKNFEILIEQQKNAPPKPGHAATHLFLGNLYLQTGEKAKALETWRAGLEKFPDDAALAGQIKANG